MTEGNAAAGLYNTYAADGDTPYWRVCCDDVFAADERTFLERGMQDARRLWHMIELLGRRGLTVMDYGCGVGRTAKPLVENWGQGAISQMLMVDVAPKVLRIAQQRCGLEPPFRHHYYLARPQDVPDTVEPQSVDFLYCDFVLQHLDWHLAARLLQRFLYLLKPDGLLWLYQPPWKTQSFVNAAKEIGSPKEPRRMRHWTWDMLSRTLLHLGYAIVAAEPDSIQVLARPGPGVDWLEGPYR